MRLHLVGAGKAAAQSAHSVECVDRGIGSAESSEREIIVSKDQVVLRVIKVGIDLSIISAFCKDFKVLGILDLVERSAAQKVLEVEFDKAELGDAFKEALSIGV